MTTPANPGDPRYPTWESLILADLPAREAWAQVFQRLGETALAVSSPVDLHKKTVIPDRLLAESAWNLWQQFPAEAPKAVDAMRDFWARATTAGAAVLVLDALSLRELPLIVAAAQKRGVPISSVGVSGSQIPSETERFAAALGLTSRSKLFNNQPPHSFIFNGPDVHTDVLEDPFADCVSRLPAKARLFIWHKWPDEPLIHLHAERPDGGAVVAAEVKKAITSDGFWAFVNAMRQGRRLLVTSDHGYATAADFSNEIKDDQTVRQFAGAFGAQRAVREDAAAPWPRRQLPPYVLRFADADSKTWLVVLGQRKWKVRGGFPTLCHRGLSLLEVAVPIIELPPA